MIQNREPGRRVTHIWSPELWQIQHDTMGARVVTSNDGDESFGEKKEYKNKSWKMNFDLNSPYIKFKEDYKFKCESSNNKMSVKNKEVYLCDLRVGKYFLKIFLILYFWERASETKCERGKNR